jgi:hypothetical protein
MIQFNIFSIKANGIENSSALNIGTNLLIGFGSATKSIQGNSKVAGDDAGLPSLYNYIDDRDQVDTPIWNGELIRPPFSV